MNQLSPEAQQIVDAYNSGDLDSGELIALQQCQSTAAQEAFNFIFG